MPKARKRKPAMGRPPEAGVAREVIALRATSDEAARWQAKADKAGKALRVWMRDTLNAEAE